MAESSDNNIGDISSFRANDNGNLIEKLNSEFYERELNVKWFGASGSKQITTGSINAGSNILTVTDIQDFQIGQYVAVHNAGVAKELMRVEILSDANSNGDITITLRDVSKAIPISVACHQVQLEITGIATSKQPMNIILNGIPHLVEARTGETPIQLCDRIRNSLYDFFPGWTVSGTPGTGKVTFIASKAGYRADNVFQGWNSGVTGTMTNLVNGDGSKVDIANKIASSIFSNWICWSAGEARLSFESTLWGTPSRAVFDGGSTGVTFATEVKIPAQWFMLSKINTINGNQIILQNTASKTVTNTTIYHDDTTPIQSAIDYAYTNNSGTIIFPTGTYRHRGFNLKDNVHLRGLSKRKSILSNFHPIMSSIKAIGQGTDDPDTEKHYISDFSIENLTLTSEHARTYGQHGLYFHLTNTFVVKDVDIEYHDAGVRESISWYSHFENIKCLHNSNGWLVLSNTIAATPTNRINCNVIRNEKYGIYLENSSDVFNWFGGAVEHNNLGGIVILGLCRSINFYGINIEGNQGYAAQIGKIDGLTPSNVRFVGCSFKNWDTSLLYTAIYAPRCANMEFENTKFFNYDIAYDLHNTGTSFRIGAASYDNCRVKYKIGSVEITKAYSELVGSWEGVLARDTNGFKKFSGHSTVRLEEGLLITPPSNNSLPAASEEHRGKILFIHGNSGTADAWYFCEKKADNTYHWRKMV